MNVADLVEPYIKDKKIDWDYVSQNIAMMLTSPSSTIRKLAEVHYRNNGDTRKCNWEINDLLRDLGGLSTFFASNFVKTDLTATLRNNLIGMSSPQLSPFAIKNMIESYLRDSEARGIITGHNGLCVKNENYIYSATVYVGFYPMIEYRFDFLIN